MGKARWAVVVTAVCLVVAAVAVAYVAGKAKAVPVQEVVRAKRFELVDAKGAVRGVISMGEDARSPGVAFLDAKGKRRAELTTKSDGSSLLALHDKSGWVRLTLTQLTEGTAFLTLHDEENRIRVLLEVASDGNPTLVMLDKEKVLWQAP